MNESKSTEMLNGGWYQALSNHLLLFIHYLLPANTLLKHLNLENRKTGILATLAMLGSSLFISLGLLGMVDGPEVLYGLITGNFRVQSAFIDGYGIYSLLLVWVILVVVGWLLPFIVTLKIAQKSQKKAQSMKVCYILSCYGMFAILFFIPLLYAIALFTAGSNPQMVQLDFGPWQNHQWYALGVIILLSIVGQALLSQKIFNIDKNGFWQSFLINFLIIAVSMAAVFLF